jgi:hypothetical protein
MKVNLQNHITCKAEVDIEFKISKKKKSLSKKKEKDEEKSSSELNSKDYSLKK